MARVAIFDPFSFSGYAAENTVLAPDLTSRSGPMSDRACSLHIEHVSPAGTLRREISRPSIRSIPSSPVRPARTSEIARRRLLARKPDAGFVRWDFPATLLANSKGRSG